MNCQLCGNKLPILGTWSITIGNNVKTYLVCKSCKDKFEKWMDSQNKDISKFKVSCKLDLKPKKSFTELEIPKASFNGMQEGDQRLYIDKNGERMILQIYKDKKWILYVTGLLSFEEEK